VAPETVSGVWQRRACKFRSGPYDKVNFFFWVTQGSTGSVWIDNLVVGPGIQLKNPSFEELEPDGSISGWRQDNRNVTIFSDSIRVADGKRSVRVTYEHEAVPLTRVWQEFAVEPNREYTLSFDMFVGDDFQGDAKGWMYDPTESHSLDFDYDNMLASKLVATRDRCARYAVALTPSATGPAAVSQVVGVGKGMNLRASVDVNNKAFQGTARLVVEAPASGKVLGETRVEAASDAWRNLQVSFQSAAAKLRVRVLAEGAGALLVDNVALTPPRVTPPLQQVKWLPASQSFRIPSPLEVFVQGRTGKAIEGGVALLNNDLKPHGIVTEKSASDKAPLRIRVGAEYEVNGKGDEAYALAIDADGIDIRAARESGAFYGLMTLLQLIESRDGKPVVLPCEATDYPDMPMRGVLYGDAEQAARWKMNTIMASTGYPVTPQAKKRMHDLVRKCQGLNLQLIPYFLSMTGGYYVQGRNPNLAAGIWVQDEEVTLKATQPSPLANRYVIRTGLTDVTLKSPDGKTEYTLGRDYRVIDGDMALGYDSAAAKPFAVARLPGSAIPDGSTVLASYDWVSHIRGARKDLHIAYVPLEPETRRLMDEFLRDLVREFPIRYVNTSNDLHEFGPADHQLATDSRIVKSGRKPIELYAEEVCSHAAAVKQGNPAARILQWTGNVGDYAKAAGPLLPKDALINVWGYDANWPSGYGREAVEYWTRLGFETSVMPWDNLRNVRGWAQVVAEARRKGYPCLGMIGSNWANRCGGFKETAIVSWKTPKAGERGFVSLPKTGQ